MSDIAVAMGIGFHIDNPCKDIYGNNVRQVYIRLARDTIKGFENPFAKEFLQEKIKKYSDENL